jgi:MFS family permease
MVKVTLELSKLVRDGAITEEEHDQLARLGKRDTGALLTNVLVGFGVVAVAAGAVAALPGVLTAMAIGCVLMAAGAWLVMSGRAQWRLLATICILVAALMLGSGLMLLSGDMAAADDAEAAPWALMPVSTAYLVVAALFTGSAMLAGSTLMAALAVLLLSAALGSLGAYGHATYMISIEQPLATVLLFTALAAALHAAAPRLPGEGERLANAAARTALLLVNLGFWVGSLWGDDAAWLLHGTGRPLPAIAFTIAWVIVLAPAALWAGQTNRRWALNLIAVFAGIHFYTQWFERLGATPVSLLSAGLLMLAFAAGLWRLNERLARPARPPGLA